MSDIVLVACISGIAPTFMALAAVITSLRNAKKIEEVHKATNSLTERLVETTRSEAHAAGIKEEKERERL